MGALYKITFENGKSYIGITSNTLKRRMSLHRSHAKDGRVSALHAAMRKFGADGHRAEVLVIADDWEYLCDLERRAIAAYATLAPHGYNLTTGGEGAPGWKASAEQRAAISRRLTGKNLGNKHTLGYRHSDAAKKKMADAHRGAIFSEERKAKISAAKIGHTYNVGRPCSEETKAKISAAQKGMSQPKERIDKMAATKSAFSPEKKAAISAAISNAMRGRKWSTEARAAQMAARSKNKAK